MARVLISSTDGEIHEMLNWDVPTPNFRVPIAVDHSFMEMLDGSEPTIRYTTFRYIGKVDEVMVYVEVEEKAKVRQGKASKVLKSEDQSPGNQVNS